MNNAEVGGGSGSGKDQTTWSNCLRRVLQTELKNVKVEAENVLPINRIQSNKAGKRKRNPALRARLKKAKKVRQQLGLEKDQATWSTAARALYEGRMAVWALNKQSNSNPLDDTLRTNLEAAYKHEKQLSAAFNRKSLWDERKQQEEA